MKIIGTERINKIVEEIVKTNRDNCKEYRNFIYINFGLNLVSKMGFKVFLNSLIFRKKIIVHWIGSDIYYVRSVGKKMLLKRILLQFLNKLFNITNWSAAPQIQRELEEIGIESKLVYIPTRLVKEVEVKPLPEEYSFITYLPKNRHEFYGSSIIFKFAERNPHIKLHIVANDGDEMPKLNNVKYHGWVKEEEMDRLYESTYGVIRMPIHDALGGTVIEAVLRGRYAIWTYDSMYSYKANNLLELETAVKDITRCKVPNIKGAKFIKENYSYDKLSEDFVSQLKNTK